MKKYDAFVKVFNALLYLGYCVLFYCYAVTAIYLAANHDPDWKPFLMLTLLLQIILDQKPTVDKEP